MSPLNSLNLVLIRGAKFDGHRRTWTGRTCEQEDFGQEKQQTLNKRKTNHENYFHTYFL